MLLRVLESLSLSPISCIPTTPLELIREHPHAGHSQAIFAPLAGSSGDNLNRDIAFLRPPCALSLYTPLFVGPHPAVRGAGRVDTTGMLGGPLGGDGGHPQGAAPLLRASGEGGRRYRP